MDSSYNNLGGFGSNGVSFSAPVSSGTGDVILTQEKKSHRKWIVVVLALVFLIIIGVFVVNFLLLKDNRLSVSEDAKLAFNRYANYLLYGEDSDKTLEGEYDESDIYKIDEMQNENTQTIANYLKTANELLINFESLVDNDLNNEIVMAINNYRANFELMRLTFNKTYIDEKELIDKVLNNNLDDVKDWIANKFSSLVKSNYEIVKTYAEEEINYFQLYAEFLENVKNVNCLNTKGIIVCDDYDDEELELQIENAFDEAEDTIWSANNDVVRQCWDLEKMMNGEKTTESEERVES